jgi:hypothetical protein
MRQCSVTLLQLLKAQTHEHTKMAGTVKFQFGKAFPDGSGEYSHIILFEGEFKALESCESGEAYIKMVRVLERYDIHREHFTFTMR